MKLFVVIYNDARLLSHFLRHYTKAGVTDFFIAVASEFEEEVKAFTEQYNIRIFKGLDVADSLLSGTAAVAEMRRIVQRPDEWVVIVDLDEYVEFPTAIESIIATGEREGANVARGIMHDRFSIDGQLAAVDPESDLPKLCPIVSRFTRDVMGGCDHKAVLVKGHLKSAPDGYHHVLMDERVCSILLEISHYKWIVGAVDRLRESYRLVAHRPWAVHYKRALDHYDAHGRFAWEEFGGKPRVQYVPETPERCSVCGAPISEKEHRYSLDHFDKALCRADQKPYRLRALA